jgi:hypothetical protein
LVKINLKFIWKIINFNEKSCQLFQLGPHNEDSFWKISACQMTKTPYLFLCRWQYSNKYFLLRSRKLLFKKWQVDGCICWWVAGVLKPCLIEWLAQSKIMFKTLKK